MKPRLRAWVLKRKLLDEHTGEVGAVLQFFYGQPPEPSSPYYQWIRMEHLDEKESGDDSGRSVGAFDNPGRY